jgi:hypothetical protein
MTSSLANRRLSSLLAIDVILYICVEVAVGVACLVMGSIAGPDWIEVTKWSTAALFVSRGLAYWGRGLPD